MSDNLGGSLVKAIICNPGEPARITAAYLEVSAEGKPTGPGLWREAGEPLPGLSWRLFCALWSAWWPWYAGPPR